MIHHNNNTATAHSPYLEKFVGSSPQSLFVSTVQKPAPVEFLPALQMLSTQSPCPQIGAGRSGTDCSNAADRIAVRVFWPLIGCGGCVFFPPTYRLLFLEGGLLNKYLYFQWLLPSKLFPELGFWSSWKIETVVSDFFWKSWFRGNWTTRIWNCRISALPMDRQEGSLIPPNSQFLSRDRDGNNLFMFCWCCCSGLKQLKGKSRSLLGIPWDNIITLI